MTPMQQDQQHQPKPEAPQPPPGKAQMSPRANGALLLGGGIALEGINGAFLMNGNTFYPKLLIAGAVLIPLGAWTLATGIAYEKGSAIKPPLWWTIGAVLLGLVGLAAGISLTAWLQE